MPELDHLPRVDDPLVHLRAAVDAHRTATQASVDAGVAVQAEKVAAAPTTPESGT